VRIIVHRERIVVDQGFRHYRQLGWRRSGTSGASSGGSPHYQPIR
jgi:hypothetical protein